MSDKIVRGLVWWLLIILVTAFVILQYLVLTYWPPVASFYQNTWPYHLGEPSKVRVCACLIHGEVMFARIHMHMH